MPELMKYGDKELTYYATMHSVEDLLTVQVGEDIYGPKPNYAEIFGTDKETGLMIAKNLIIDLFQMIADDIVNKFCQITFPLTGRAESGITNLLVNSIESGNFSIETGNIVSIPQLKMTKYTSYLKLGKFPQVKLDIKWHRIIMANTKKKLFYLSSRRK